MTKGKKIQADYFQRTVVATMRNSVPKFDIKDRPDAVSSMPDETANEAIETDEVSDVRRDIDTLDKWVKDAARCPTLTEEKGTL